MKIFRYSTHLYTMLSLVLYGILLTVLYHFHDRKMHAVDYAFNLSIIERIPEDRYRQGLLFLVIMIVIMVALLFGLWKNVRLAKIAFVILFLSQMVAVALLGLLLKDIEGVYFWKSPYTQKYLMGVAGLMVVSLLVVINGLMPLFRKKAIKQA